MELPVTHTNSVEPSVVARVAACFPDMWWEMSVWDLASSIAKVLDLSGQPDPNRVPPSGPEVASSASA